MNKRGYNKFLEISKDIEVAISEEKIAEDYRWDGLKVYKELERLIAVNRIGMSVDKVLDAAKTITTIRVRLPENKTTLTKTLFLTEKHLAVKPLFDISNSKP